MGCQIKRLGQAISDLPLSEIFATRWRSKLGKTAPKHHFWALSVVFGAIPRLVGYHSNRLGQAGSDLPLSEIFTTRRRSKWGKLPQNTIAGLSASFLELYLGLMGIIGTVLAMPAQIYHFQ